VKIYSEDLTADEQKTIIAALAKALDESGIKVERIWGEAIENRGSQITLSVLGQQAPLSAKESWDPDFAKRKKITAPLGANDPQLFDPHGRHHVNRRHEARH
jgi:phosphomannomutase